MSEEVAERIDEAMLQARPDENAGRVLARARVESALFGNDATGVARFHVLEQLGRGGMGVVYAAYDPELDRGVALKMIRVPDAGREMALAEAKALAKLSHPNVVPVFDVGTVEDQVYIVMELVRGDSLRSWVENKSVREIVEMYRQAGSALAAAHAAGLVHRDFKPDNAIVGSDGRVRVVDFGLACETSAALTAPRSIAGTPRYMAPEQQRGEVSPAIDQYSFCVALDEALRAGDAKREPPRWIAALLERGRAADPHARFGAMAELVRALGRDPGRIWRRRLGVGFLAAAGVAAFFVGQARATEGPPPCTGGTEQLDQAWSPEARAQRLAQLGALGVYGKEVAAQLGARIADYRTRWTAEHRAACLAHRAGAISPALLDRRMICLDRSRAALGAVAELASSIEAPGLPDLARAASAIPDPAQCSVLTALADDSEAPPAAIAARVTTLRDQLERARIQLVGGRANAARDGARAIANEMRTAGYQPLEAEALLLAGHAMMRSDPQAARATLGKALEAALASHADAVAIEAWARRAWLAGTQADGGESSGALGGLDVVEMLAKRTPAAGFARALLYNNVGSVEIARQHRAEARAALAVAQREARGITGAGAIELTAIPRNLALVTDDVREADRYLEARQSELARLLGASHPDVLVTAYMRATTSIESLERARQILDGTCDRFELHESLAELASECFVELADLRDELGDRAGALAAYERAARAPHPEAPEIDIYIAIWRGAARTALPALEKALAQLRADAEEFFERYRFATLQLAYGRALLAVGKPDAARMAFDHALAALGPPDAHRPPAVQRREIEIAAELAAVSTGPRRAELATRASAWYRRAGAPAAKIAALEARSR